MNRTQRIAWRVVSRILVLCVAAAVCIGVGLYWFQPVGADTGAETPRDPNRMWCAEHGKYEDECEICHPELAEKNKEQSAEVQRDPNRLWCEEHGKYEDECEICHPELVDAAKEKGSAQRAGEVLMCTEHRLPEAECGNCRPDALANLPIGKGLKIRFPSPEAAAKAGVTTGAPLRVEVNGNADWLGQVTFNRNRLAVVSPLVSGVLSAVSTDVGASVQAGQVLATMVSPSLTEAASAYAKALTDAQLRRETFAREKKLFDKEITPRQDLETAKAALDTSQSDIAEARQHLLALGLNAEQIDGLAQSGSATLALPIRAPIAGVVIERNAVTGTAVEPGKELFRISDLSVMWMELSIPETRLAEAKEGVPVQARFDALPGRIFEGKLTWIAFTVDETTRAIQARAELENTEQLLKHGLFGRARLSGPDIAATLAVPEDAVQTVDGRPVLFAKIEDDLYEARNVQLGAKDGGLIAVLDGIAETDELALGESYIVKSEMLKGRLGAGCTDH